MTQQGSHHSAADPRNRDILIYVNGTLYPRETLRIFEELELDRTTRDKIYYKNLERITGRTLVK